ncbi:MAG: serine hydrolase [Lactobacillaceae bacterium]|jgi:D-alanyl-D-alanine carboxypeptidase (penicillin-binding protein 5/6)|nr:serine hydrolase [Lactobacillaceae bacterium]
MRNRRPKKPKKQNALQKARLSNRPNLSVGQKVLAIFVELFVVLSVVSLFVALAVNIGPKNSRNSMMSAKPLPMRTTVGGSIVVDYQTGQVLMSHNEHKLVHNGSTSKLITAYLVQKAIKEGKITWDQKVTPPQIVITAGLGSNLANIPLLNEQYSVATLYSYMLNLSANSAAATLGNLVAGNQAKFVTLANKTLKSFGIPEKEYKIYNSTGLSTENMLTLAPKGLKKKDENQLSAKALATITYRLVKDYPQSIERFDSNDITTPDGNLHVTTINNINRVYNLNGYANIEAIAPKTGTSQKGGISLTGLFRNKSTGREFIATTLNGAAWNFDPGPVWTLTKNFVIDADLAGHTFTFYPGQQIDGAKSIDLMNTVQTSTKLYVKDKVNIWVRSSNPKTVPSVDVGNFNTKITQMDSNDILMARVNNVSEAEKLYGISQDITVPLYSKQTLTENWNPFAKFWRLLIH